jgi:hypothetical protein
MLAYIYQADIYCEDCAKDIMLRTPDKRAEEDSNAYPQGPYDNGGGEADCPQHCGSCGVFLENPLTGYGCEYVCEALGQITYDNAGNRPVLRTWAARYAGTDTMIDNAIQEWQALHPEDWT